MRRLTLRLVLLVIALVPARAQAWLVRRLALARYHWYYRGTRRQAELIRERLGVDAARAEQILKRRFELDLLGILDGMRLRSLTPHEASSLVEFRGLDRLVGALAEGRGVVVTTAHGEGLFTALAALGLRGYAPQVIRISAEVCGGGRLSRRLTQRMDRRLERCGCRFLWMEPGRFAVGARALNAVRRGLVVVSPIDLSHSDDNATVRFLGGPAEFPRGLPLLAKVSRAPIVDLFVYRDATDQLVGEFGEPRHVSDVDAGVQHAATCLERQILAHPEDWSPWHVFDAWRGLSPSPLSSPTVPAAAELVAGVGGVTSAGG